MQTYIHLHTHSKKNSAKDNQWGRHICLGEKLQDRLQGGEKMGGQARTPKSLSPQQEACWRSRWRRGGSLSHLGSLGRGLRAKGGVEFGRSADALIKPRVRFPTQLSTNAAVQARNEYSQSANRRKCFTKTEPEGVKGKQALFTRRQTAAAAAQHSPEEAETQA